MIDETDEVKVFRTGEEEEDEESTGQGLKEDKKDVVLEDEYQERQQHTDQKAGDVFPKPEASPRPVNGFVPVFPAVNPNFININPMLPYYMMNAFMARPMMSPVFLPFGVPSMSPSFMMNQLSMNSPIYDAMANFNNRNMQQPTNMWSNIQNQMQQKGRQDPQMNFTANNKANEPRRTPGKINKDEHVKKPLNAFMWYMKENRANLLEEDGYKDKQSADVNKELGKRWTELPDAEKQKYYEMSKKDKEDHKVKYPDWSARMNYSSNKPKKQRRDKSDESSENKKCRARFGNENRQLWCKSCLRKKKCEHADATHDENTGDVQNIVSVSLSTPAASPADSSIMDPPSVGQSESGSHSETEFEDDIDMEDDEDVEDLTLTRAALKDLHGSMASQQRF